MKTLMRHHFILTRIIMIKENNNKYWWTKGEKKGEIEMLIVSGNAKWCNHFENRMVVPQKVWHIVTMWLRTRYISTPWYLPKINANTCLHKYLNMNVNKNIVHKSQKLEKTQMPNWLSNQVCMVMKCEVFITWNTMIKKRSTNTVEHDEPWTYNAEETNHKRLHVLGFHLYEMSRGRESIERVD